jgi:signal transduction histidine kinase
MDVLIGLLMALMAGFSVGWLLRGRALKSRRGQTAHPSSESLLLSVNHDLRQPLQAQGLFITALNQRPLPEDLARLSSRIEASHTSFVNEFDALIDLARLNEGRLKTNTPGEFHPGDLWNRIADDSAPLSERRSQMLRFHQGKHLLPGDLILLQKILRPLVTASLLASEEGGMVLAGARKRAGKWRIELWHGAPGLEVESLTAILDLSPEPPPYPVGLPLGLPLRLAHRLCPLSGVRLGGRSVPGKGGVLWLELPEPRENT